MSYKRTMPFSTTFRGAKVTATLLPLLFEHILLVEGLDVEAKSDSEADQKQAAFKSTFELAKRIRPHVPEYVRDFVGIVDDQGVAVPIEEVCRVAYFAPLIMELALAVVNGGLPQDPQQPPAPSGS